MKHWSHDNAGQLLKFLYLIVHWAVTV